MAELRTHRPFRDFRYRTQTDRGEQVWFSISGVPVFDADGGFQGYRGTACNVTAEVLAGQRAEQAQQRLRDAIESITHGFALFDARTGWFYATTTTVRRSLVSPTSLNPVSLSKSFSARCWNEAASTFRRTARELGRNPDAASAAGSGAAHLPDRRGSLDRGSRVPQPRRRARDHSHRRYRRKADGDGDAS